jgi:transcription elongation GreA/GreB family factor
MASAMSPLLRNHAMTATLPQSAQHTALLARLDELHTARLEALAELTAESCGDDADRATNVDAQARVALLDRRIAALEEDLGAAAVAGTARIRPGDVVTLDFGDGPEPYVFGSVERATDGNDVITPGSPLGRALADATVGATISYAVSRHRTMRVTVVAIT